MSKVSDIFEVKYGHSLELNRLKIVKNNEGIAFVSRKMGDNGISAYVESIAGVEPAPAGYLSCALGGNGVLTTHLQEQPFYVGRDVALLKPKTELSTSILLFYSLCIKKNRFKYSYGRQANRTLKNIEIPSLDEIPAWIYQVNPNQFDYADEPTNQTKTPIILNTKQWEEFELNQLFELKKGKRLTKSDMTKGSIPYIGAIDSNNGISAYVGQVSIHKGNTLTISYDGSIGEAFYQFEDFWASDAVNVLYPKFEMTTEIALFLCTLIRKEKYRFNYGRKWHLERMKESVIRLPTIESGEPDWDFMERYIKSLPFSSQLR